MNNPITHPQALTLVNDILLRDNTTWQEKKNLLADLLIKVSTSH